MLKILLIIIALCGLNGCAKNANKVNINDSPFVESTSTKHQLMAIPELKGQPQITIAVYSFPDMTGQRKPSTKFSQLSMAVSQGADTWVISALKSVGKGTWFRVVERKGLDSLVKERQLIRSTRELYDGKQEVGNVLKPLIFAGLLIEGGIIGYDANIASHKTGMDVFRFLDMSTKAFEVESGVAVNEPVNYAVRTAIEYCLLEILKLGDKEELWKIKY